MIRVSFTLARYGGWVKMSEDGPVASTSRNVLSTSGIGNVIQSGSIYGGVHIEHATQAPVTPRQLPIDSARFIGRVEELDRLASMLDVSSGTVVISAINGTAGIGKTTLAVHWAHEVVEQFPDGQLYVNLRGFDAIGEPIAPVDVIRGFLDAFGLTPERIPINPEAQAAMYRSLLADRRVLVVLDNARDVDQVRSLLPGSNTCVTVITSRNSLSGLSAHEGTLALTLDLLNIDEAKQLFIRHLGRERVEQEPQSVEHVIDACARLPLALAIAAIRMTELPTLTFRALAKELAAERHRVDSFDAGDTRTNLRAVFSWSYRALRPAAARLFRLLGLHFGPDLSLLAASSLVGSPVAEVRRWLAELTRGHLLSEYEPGRYRFHDLLRDYAAAMSAAEDSHQAREEAQERLIHHYMVGSRDAGVLIDPYGERVPLLPCPSGVEPPIVLTYRQALDWCATEHLNLVGSVHQAVRLKKDDLACQMAAELCSYLDRSAHWTDWAATQEAVLACARRIHDDQLEANIQRFIGWANARLGRYTDALTRLFEALTVSARFTSVMNEARIHHAISWTYAAQERFEQALTHAQRSHRLYQESGGRESRQALALTYVGRYHARLGQHSLALKACQEALGQFIRLGDDYGSAVALDSLGLIYQGLDQSQDAIDCYRRSAALWHKLDDAHNEAASFAQLGHAQYAYGELEGAKDSWQRALATFDKSQHPAGGLLRASIAKVQL